jgi:hypothetical protein
MPDSLGPGQQFVHNPLGALMQDGWTGLGSPANTLGSPRQPQSNKKMKLPLQHRHRKCPVSGLPFKKFFSVPQEFSYTRWICSSSRAPGRLSHSGVGDFRSRSTCPHTSFPFPASSSPAKASMVPSWTTTALAKKRRIWYSQKTVWRSDPISPLSSDQGRPECTRKTALRHESDRRQGFLWDGTLPLQTGGRSHS